MQIFKETISEEEQEMRHAQQFSAWTEIRLSIEGFRAPEPAELRRGADEFKSELLASVLAHERDLETARELVVQAALECAAFQHAHGEGAENSGLTPFVAIARRLSKNLKEQL